MSATHPKLARFARLRWDPKGRAHMLIYPERGLVLNETATEVVKRCDGTRTEREIADELAGCERDVHAFIERLRDRRLVE